MTETPLERLILSLRVAAKTGQYPLPPTEQPGYMFAGRPVVVDSLTLEDAAYQLEALSRSNGETRGHAGHMAACKTAPVTRTGGPLDEVLSLARRVAFLHFHAEDRADNSQLLARECQRLYDALARFDGDNPDLTFCCGCREEIEIENGQEQWVLDGAKYHGGCYQQEVSAREALSRSPEGGEILTDFPDLTIRLRSVLEPEWIKPWCREAADCIESLMLEVERLKKALSQPPEGKE